MGTVSSDLTQNIKAQAREECFLNNSIRPIDNSLYQLIGVNGGGELVQLAKISLTTKNFQKLDIEIKTKVINYLVGPDGNGENVIIYSNIFLKHNLLTFNISYRF
jgi:hypothetical protein